MALSQANAIRHVKFKDQSFKTKSMIICHLHYSIPVTPSNKTSLWPVTFTSPIPALCYYVIRPFKRNMPVLARTPLIPSDRPISFRSGLSKSNGRYWIEMELLLKLRFISWFLEWISGVHQYAVILPLETAAFEGWKQACVFSTHSRGMTQLVQLSNAKISVNNRSPALNQSSSESNGL